MAHKARSLVLPDLAELFDVGAKIIEKFGSSVDLEFNHSKPQQAKLCQMFHNNNHELDGKKRKPMAMAFLPTDGQNPALAPLENRG